MKKFFGAIALCSAVLAVCSFVLVRVADADQPRGDLITDLLNLPAPPPPNPLERATARRTDGDAFYSADNPPPDNAPIEDILDYWAKQRYGNLNDNLLPSPVVLDRIAAAMESDPSKIGAYLNYLKDSQRGINSVRSAYNRAVAENASAANAGANGATNAIYANVDYYDGDYDGGYDGRSDGLKRWLILNDPTFSSELEPLAAEAKDTENGYIQNDDEFLALARNDWSRARPLVDKMYSDPNQPASKTLATWALYKKALDDGSLSDAERYRDELKRTVESRQLSVGVRDLALDALSLNEEWSGRDDWYFSLMKDPTMLDFGTYTGLTTLITRSKSGKYKAKMIKLLEDSDPTVRAAAARNLSIEVNKGDIDAIKALIPWLENPDWIKNTGDARGSLVRALGQVKVAESVHGLIAVMNERVETRRYVETSDDIVANAAEAAAEKVMRAANAAASNGANANYYGPVNTGPTYSYPYRYSAITALAKQANPVAIPALRRLYNELANDDGPDSYMSGQVINALFTSGGFTVPEQVAALESYARSGGELLEKIRTAAKESRDDLLYEIMADRMISAADQFDEKLARLSAEQDEPSDALVAATIQRIKALEPRDPQTAKMMRDMVVGWNTRAANAMQLGDLKDGNASLATVVNLLARRKQLRETQANDVYDARGGVPAAAGIATCILEDTPSYSAILNDTNTAVKAAFLACARLVRIPISPDDAARELASPDKKLALAAKMYLISEDSARSRQILYAAFPDEILIAGSQTFFMGAGDEEAGMLEADMRALFASVDARFDSEGNYGSSYQRMLELQKDERRFQKEVAANEDIVGLYAYGNNVVRIYADRVTYDREDDDARSYRRVLSPREFDRLKNILANHRVGEMKPFITCAYGCALRELIMLGRVGGSRVFTFADKMPELFKELDEYFETVGKDQGVLHYSATDKVPGLQVIFADPRLRVETVWADGGDVRFFATDVAAREAADREVDQKIREFYRRDDDDDASVDYSYPVKLREKSEYVGRGWFAFGAERIDPTTGPAGVELPPREPASGLETFSSPWAVRAGGSELQKDDEALYKVTGANRVKVADGNFYQVVISPDGRWILGRMIDEEAGDSALVRIDAGTGRKYPVDEGGLRFVVPVAWVPGVNKFLVSYANYGGREETNPMFLRFIDPVTGQISPVSGQVMPFAQQSFRPLQPATGGGAWAAVTDEKKNETSVGIIELPSLKFTKRVTIPDTKFNSMEMWVDEKAGVLYFVYSGHLLRVPIEE